MRYLSNQTTFQPGQRGAFKVSARLQCILSLIGFTSVIAQIVLMRELIVVFYGNEISLGIMLAGWLLWTAIGSSVLGQVSARWRDSRKLMACLETLIAGGFPADHSCRTRQQTGVSVSPRRNPWPSSDVPHLLRHA